MGNPGQYYPTQMDVAAPFTARYSQSGVTAAHNFGAWMLRWIEEHTMQIPGTGDPQSLSRLKWLAILAPVLFLVLLELVRQLLLPTVTNGWILYGILLVIVFIGIYLFAETIFSVIGRMQEQLAQQNRELWLLHQAGLDITSALELEVVLQKVVDQARDLVGAQYGALSLVEEAGGIQAFLTSGITREQRELIGPIPEGHGLLGLVLHQGERLRLDDLTKHPESEGFPHHHPPMKSLLAVPILVQDNVVGNLYLTEKIDGGSFSISDEDTLERFATQAALAIDNARLHRQVQAMAITEERERLAREMHDSLAQLLGYVNTKAQAADQFLQNGNTERGREHLQQLSQAAREAYSDVREGILGLRTASELEQGVIGAITSFTERWQDQTGLQVDLSIDYAGRAADALSAISELQLLRIVQEALSNVRKHSGASRASVELREQDDGVLVRITDDGVGFDPDAVERRSIPRFGLSIMNERANAVGGWLTIEANHGNGTTVTGFLPAQVRASQATGDTREGTDS
jgi:signal transduction histidine kinase